MSKAAELAALIGSQTALSNRNLIINGAFQVWQRATAATAVGGSDVFNTVDRWSFWENTDGAFTTEQSTDVPSGQGFAYSLKAACTSADTSLAAGQFSLIGHKIEAQNLSQLNYGTSSAKTMTLSFWVKSNKTGTYCFSIEKDDETDYILIKEFSVSSADTWEKKTLTITPDSNIKASAGAITNDNGLGLRLLWALALGTTYNSGSDDGTWTDSTLFGTTNQVNWMDSDSNEFYITGVQLELGETATPFEHEDHGTTLRKCMRYFQLVDNGIGKVTGLNNNVQMLIKAAFDMRASPSMSVTTLRVTDCTTSDYDDATVTVGGGNINLRGGRTSLGMSSTAAVGTVVMLLGTGTNAAPVQLSAEL